MRNFIKVFLVALLVLIPSVIFAQKTLKFGHINSQEVIQLMPQRDSAVIRLQKFNKELSDSYEEQNVELNKKYQKFLEEEKTLNDVVKKTRQEELQQIQQRIQQFQENANQQIQAKQTELMQPILEKLKKAIADVGKEGGFIYVFDIGGTTNVLFFSAESQDITALVKQKLGIKK